MESFGTVLNCMDGRVQRKAADYLSASFGVRHLDTITTAGIVKHLAAETSQTATLLENVGVSTNNHGSTHIAIVAHHDCAGNPIADKAQKEQVAMAVGRLRELNPNAEVVGLWINGQWIVEKVAWS